MWDCFTQINICDFNCLIMVDKKQYILAKTVFHGGRNEKRDTSQNDSPYSVQAMSIDHHIGKKVLSGLMFTLLVFLVSITVSPIHCFCPYILYSEDIRDF